METVQEVKRGAPIAKESKLKRVIRRMKKDKHLHLMLMPAVILVLIFNYIPMPGIVIAFKDYKPWLGIAGSEWVGLENFKMLFTLPDSMQVIKNTLFLSTFGVVLGIVVPVTFAILLNEIRQQGIKRSIQTLVYLPHFISWVILSGIFLDLLASDGSVNQILQSFGIQSVPFLTEGNWFRATLIITSQWKEFGFSTIIFLAGLSAINPALYESAQIDGASRLKQTIHVTIPGLMPTIIVVGILSLGNILSANFDQVFNMINPLVMGKGDIIDTFVYRTFSSGNFSFATTIGLFKSVVGFVLIVASYYSAYKWADYKIF